MKILAPSAMAVAMLFSVGSASAACNYHQMTMASVAPEPAQPVASAKVKQMVMNYLEELTEERRIA